MSGRNAALADWYRSNGRDLPWRRTRDRWAILVSEVMLQQTQVSRVIPAYESFVERYPTAADFAEATPEQVIAVWGGLGYLRRARNLHATARIIAADGWPDDLSSLPGVGSYTASAVSAFADGAVVAAVDVNLRRVLSRWHGTALSDGEARRLGNRQVDADRPDEWNQAMMDLGATVCRPASPRCGECPVSTWCTDPSIEIATKRQSPFSGSVRQARAAVLKSLAAGPVHRSAVGDGLDEETVARAVDDLAAEGAVVIEGDRLRLG